MLKGAKLDNPLALLLVPVEVLQAEVRPDPENEGHCDQDDAVLENTDIVEAQPLQEGVAIGDAPHGCSLLLGALEHQPTELVDCRRTGAVVQEIDVLDPSEVGADIRRVDVEAVEEHEDEQNDRGQHVGLLHSLACCSHTIQ